MSEHVRIAIRYLALADISILLLLAHACLSYYRRDLPVVVRGVTRVYGIVLTATGAGVALNAATVPPTPGVILLAAVATPLTAVSIVLAAVALRREAAAHRELVAEVHRIYGLPPCETPDCEHARAELARLAGITPEERP